MKKIVPSNVQEIDHNAHMIHRSVSLFEREINHFYGRLARVASNGGFITDETLEAIRLEADAIILRKLAAEMLDLRDCLLANVPAPYRAVAAE